MRNFILIFSAILTFCCCTSREEKMQQTAKENLTASLDYPKQLKIMAISAPDSAFGTTYFTEKETQGMMRVMGTVTRHLMDKTRGLEDPESMDAYTAALLRRQMSAIGELRTMVTERTKKGEWSGWKVKIDYSCKDASGIPYKAERWVFLDKKGNNVVKTFEIPLP